MKIRDDEGQDTASINLTPMIDVVFLLLIFFMVSTTFIDLEKEIDIDLPESSFAKTISNPNKEIVINLHADGRIRVEGTEMNRDHLTYLIQRAVETNPDQEVIIRGDREAVLDKVVPVMSLCQRANVRNLSIATRESP